MSAIDWSRFSPVSPDDKQRQKKVVSKEITVFKNQLDKTLQSLDISIAEATGRFVDGKPMAHPKPSRNWKLPKGKKDVERGLVEVFVKIGNEYLEIEGWDNPTTMMFPQSQVVPVLQGIKELFSRSDFKETVTGKNMHELAKKITGLAKNRKNDGDYDYNPDKDIFEETQQRIERQRNKKG